MKRLAALSISIALGLAVSLADADVRSIAAAWLLDPVKFTGSTGDIFVNTVDGSDSGSLLISSGGAAPSDGTRGAGVFLYGNENGSTPGKLELIAGNAGGDGRIQIITKAASAINFLTGNSQRLAISGTGTATFTGQVLSSTTSDIGWTIQSAANQACNTTCTSACVFGQETTSKAILACTDATADTCLCAGAS